MAGVTQHHTLPIIFNAGKPCQCVKQLFPVGQRGSSFAASAHFCAINVPTILIHASNVLCLKKFLRLLVLAPPLRLT